MYTALEWGYLEVFYLDLLNCIRIAIETLLLQDSTNQPTFDTWN